jgi:hypothetical protein
MHMKPLRSILGLVVLLFAISLPALASGGTMETPPAPAPTPEPTPVATQGDPSGGTMETPPLPMAAVTILGIVLSLI